MDKGEVEEAARDLVEGHRDKGEGESTRARAIQQQQQQPCNNQNPTMGGKERGYNEVAGGARLAWRNVFPAWEFGRDRAADGARAVVDAETGVGGES